MHYRYALRTLRAKERQLEGGIVSTERTQHYIFFISTHAARYAIVHSYEDTHSRRSISLSLHIAHKQTDVHSFFLTPSFSLFCAVSIKMPDAGSRKRFAVIRDIVTRVHVVTVRIRDGVTRYALCTHVTPRGAAADAFPPPVPRCTTAQWTTLARFVRNESLTCSRLHFRVRGTRKKGEKKRRGLFTFRESYTLLIPRGKTWVKWREHNDGALITHIAASLFSTTHRQRNLARVSYINAITITKHLHSCDTPRIEARNSTATELLRLAPTKIHSTRDITSIRNVPRTSGRNITRVESASVRECRIIYVCESLIQCAKQKIGKPWFGTWLCARREIC